MLIPVALAVVTLGGLAANKMRKRSEVPPKKVLTPERAEILNRTLNTKDLSPEKIRQVAAAFAGEGFKPEAELLRRRAALRELPEEIKQERRAIYRKAMACKDKKKVMAVAEALEADGAVGAARTLKAYARGLE